MSLLELYCSVDDFWQAFSPHYRQALLANGTTRERAGTLSPSEIMTILIHFHQSHYRDFKAYYLQHVWLHLRREFPDLISYTRFIDLMPRMLLPLLAHPQTCYGDCSGLSFVDATSLTVCHPKRKSSHKVFATDTAWGKTSMGWFYGFKLHLVVNDCGELLACCLTPGNIDDRQPVASMSKALWGKLLGDRGYISNELFQELWKKGIHLLTRVRKNRKNRLIPLYDKVLLRKRVIIESVIDQLKNISQIEHSRHRSPTNFVVHLLAGLISYCHQPKKPSLYLDQHPLLAA